MLITRESFTAEFKMLFARPSIEAFNQGPRFLEGLLESLGTDYLLASRDVRIRNGPALDDWLVSLSLFNGQGKVVLTANGFNCAFGGLLGDADLKVAVSVIDRVTKVLANHAPTLRVAGESISGSLICLVADGARARNEYFSRVQFPGRGPSHQDLSFKCRMRHAKVNAIGSFEVAPAWHNDDHVLVMYDVDISQLGAIDFPARAAVVVDLISTALDSFELARTKEAGHE